MSTLRKTINDMAQTPTECNSLIPFFAFPENVPEAGEVTFFQHLMPATNVYQFYRGPRCDVYTEKHVDYPSRNGLIVVYENGHWERMSIDLMLQRSNEITQRILDRWAKELGINRS